MSTADSAAVTPPNSSCSSTRAPASSAAGSSPGRQRTACGGGRHDRLGGGRLGLLAAQDAEHAPDVRERLAGAGGDGGERLPRGGTVALVEQARHLAGLAGDRREASGGGRLEVGGDPHPLLLGGRGRIAPARPLEPLGLVRELSPEQVLTARPAADQQREQGDDEGQRGLGRGVDRRVETDARTGQCGGGDDRGDDAVVAAGAVERHDEHHQRDDRVPVEQVGERCLREERERDGRQREQRLRPAPGQGERAERDGERAHEPAVVRAEQHLHQARHDEAHCQQEIAPHPHGT